MKLFAISYVVCLFACMVWLMVTYTHVNRTKTDARIIF